MIEQWNQYGQPVRPLRIATLECGCSCDGDRCATARRLHDTLTRLRIVQDALQGRRVQVAIQLATHLYDLRRSMRRPRRAAVVAAGM